MTCQKAVRSTCKNWNVVLSKNRSFTIKHIGRAATAALREKVTAATTASDGHGYRVDLVSIILYGINNNIDLSIKRKGTLVSQDTSGHVLNMSCVQLQWFIGIAMHLDKLENIEIWVTSEIEPDAVSLSCFLKTKIMLYSDCGRLIGKFFIDEEKKVAVVFYETYLMSCTCCIIGENGYFRRSVDLTKFADLHLLPFVCSYVPTSVQI